MVSTPKVQYAYDETLDGDELVKGLRPTQLIYPNGRIVRYEYAESGSSSGSGDDPDDLLNRIKFIADDDEGAVGTHLAEYTRLGLDAIVQVDYTEPQIRYDLAHGSGDDPYDGLDRFGRVVDLLWRNYNTSEDVVRIRHGYDRAGNRLYREDPVAAAHGVDMDEAYTYDGLYQLKTFVRGALNAQKTAIAAPTFRQSWDFDTTGNWSQFHEDQDGDGHWDLDQTRTHNPANEITSIDATIGDIWVSPTHDRNGNMLRIPQPADRSKQFTLKWDAWNRLVKVSDAESVVAEYEYDGRNFRVVTRLHVDPDQLPTPHTRHFYYNNDWQCLEERLDQNAGVSCNADRHFLWGVRYIDDLILRDRDTSNPGEGVLEERLYATQDASWNVVGMVNSEAQIRERFSYSAYGSVNVLTASYWSRHESTCGWEYHYTGRRLALETGCYYFRARFDHSTFGRFVGRDPAGYEPDVNLYVYVGNEPISTIDPEGLRRKPIPPAGAGVTLPVISNIAKSWYHRAYGWTPLGFPIPSKPQVINTVGALTPVNAGVGLAGVTGGKHIVTGLPLAAGTYVGATGMQTCIGAVVACPGCVVSFHFAMTDQAYLTVSQYAWPANTCRAVICGGDNSKASNDLLISVINSLELQTIAIVGIIDMDGCFYGFDGRWYVGRANKKSPDVAANP